MKYVQFMNVFFGAQNRFNYWTNETDRDKIYEVGGCPPLMFVRLFGGKQN